MKKFLSFLIVVTIVVSLVGCGGNDTNKELEDSESTYTEQSSNVESSKNTFDDEPYNKDEIEYFSILESTNNNGLNNPNKST